jgi:hypothetical protein
MTSKSAPIPFQPAPRPQPRVSPEQTRELAEITRDLGFGRTTSTPAEAPAETGPPTAAPQVGEPIGKKAAPLAVPSTPTQSESTALTPTAASASDRMATLKVAMPDDIWNALRLEALNRRVTVRYLVMEALAAKGYDIDLSQVAEDGRRLR